MRSLRATILAGLVLLLLSTVFAAQTQNNSAGGSVSTLSAALAAACRADQFEFSSYLTPSSAAAFRTLSPDRRTALLKRFSLSDSPGRPLISTGANDQPVLHCQTPSGTTEFRFGETRTEDNLAWIAVQARDSGEVIFGLVHQNGAWRLLSLGLVLLDIPQLAKQWDEQDAAGREAAALAILRSLEASVEAYRRAYGKLPDSLAQLGPAPKDEVSPDQAGLIAGDLASGTKAGYQFRYRVASPGAASADGSTFEITAAPIEYGPSGRRSFFLDAAGKLHAADKHGTLASGSDPLVEPDSNPATGSPSGPPS